MAQLAFEEKVWADEGRKLEGVRRDLARAAVEGANVLLLAHFEETLSALGSMLRARSVEHRTHFGDDASALCAEGRADEAPKVWLALAAHFRAQGLATAGGARQSRVLILVAEHHPLAPRDEAVLEAASRVPCRNEVVFHAALTDALLKRFGGERLQGLMRRLGHDEGECVSHPFISKAIRQAQEKIGAQVAGELPTRSAEDWFRYNLRGAL
jgi:preprotein translocase subunit SecA